MRDTSAQDGRTRGTLAEPTEPRGKRGEGAHGKRRGDTRPVYARPGVFAHSTEEHAHSTAQDAHAPQMLLFYGPTGERRGGDKNKCAAFFKFQFFYLVLLTGQ